MRNGFSKGLVGFLLPLILILSGCGLKHVEETVYPTLKPFEKSERQIIAIMPFKNKSELEEYKDLAAKIPDKIISELHAAKRFRIIERARINEVAGEIELGMTGFIEESKAVTIGKQLGAKMVLFGSLTNIKFTESRKSVGIAYINTREVTVDMDARLINVENGEVEVIAKATGKEIQQKKVAMGATMGELSDKETLINKAIDRAIKELSYRLAKEVEPVK